ncbi:MAG: response regulator [Chloroflexi bacterium]|nr:response regulator [Chloroflexota bacterium]
MMPFDADAENLEEGQEVVPDEFVSLVRDALAHLYDYAYLERHPLTRLVEPVNDSASVSRALRNLLLDTIEQLYPGDGVTRSDRAWRPYGILVQRYVDGAEIDDVRNDLHISLRQFQREHRKAVLAVASILWRLSQAHSTPHSGPRAESGGLQAEISRLGLQLQWLDLGALIEQVLDSVRILAGEQGVHLGVLPGAQIEGVRADPTLLRQALLGCYSTFIGLRPERIETSWQGDAEQIVIRVEMIGLPARANPSAEREAEARLQLAAELLEAQRGTIELVREKGRIAAVTLSIPLAQGRVVLAIDDDRRLLQLFERYLVPEGYRFRGATSAQGAIEILEHEPVAAILLDIMMRGIDGWQFLQMLRARPELNTVPIIVASVLDERELAYALGAQYYLKKPVSQQQVLAALQQVLSSQS